MSDINIKVIKKAIGYIRISTEDQSTYSLVNQEDYIVRETQKQDYELINPLFRDEGFSAKTLQRPGLINLLEYCRKSKDRIQALFVYRYDRLSRDTYDFLSVKKKLVEYGIRVISCTEVSEDNPTGEFMTTVLSAMSKLDNQIRAQRALDGMKKRFESGWWANGAKFGYVNQTSETGDKIIVPHPDYFIPLQRAWHEFAKGTYTLTTITRKMRELGLPMIKQKAQRILRDPFYMGVMLSKRWNREKKGLHQPMIDEAIFFRVQALLDGKSYTAKPHLRNNPNFPLRGIIRCEVCNTPLTGAFAKKGKYAYYYCPKRDHKGVAIPKDKLEQAFVTFLKSITPSKPVLLLMTNSIRNTWHKRFEDLENQQKWIERDLQILEDRKKTLIQKNLDGLYPDDLFREQYELLSHQLISKKTIFHESVIGQINIDVLTTFLEQFLADLSKSWLDGTLEQRQILASSIIPSGAVFKNNVIRTDNLGGIFQYLQSKSQSSTSTVLLGERLRKNPNPISYTTVGGAPLAPPFILSAQPSASLYVFFAKTEMRAIFLFIVPQLRDREDKKHKYQNVFLTHPTHPRKLYNSLLS